MSVVPTKKLFNKEKKNSVTKKIQKIGASTKNSSINVSDVDNVTVRKPRVLPHPLVENSSVLDTTNDSEYATLCNSSISLSDTPKMMTSQGIEKLKLENDELIRQLIKAKEEIKLLQTTNSEMANQLLIFETYNTIRISIVVANRSQI